jgi:phosphoribosylamine--glycine ligase
MLRVENDLIALLQSVADGTLDRQEMKISPQAAAAVMLVSGGYPGNYEKGKPIEGLEDTKDCIVFHAGTALVDERPVTAGGRVIAVCATADNAESALAAANRNAEIIRFDGKYFRKDIGFDLKTV